MTFLSQVQSSIDPSIELLMECKEDSIDFYQDGQFLGTKTEPFSGGTPEPYRVEWYFWTAQDVVSRLAIKTGNFDWRLNLQSTIYSTVHAALHF